MDKKEVENRMLMSRELIMLTLRSQVIPFLEKVKKMPEEQKKCEDMLDYDWKCLFDWVESYLESGFMVKQKDSLELIRDVLEYKATDGKQTNGLSSDIARFWRTLNTCKDYFSKYKEDFYQEGKYSEFTFIDNYMAKIVDCESEDVQFEFNAKDGTVVDNTPWKILSGGTRNFLSNYIVSGFLKQELLKHQIELRQEGDKFITLDEFMIRYRELKKGVDSGDIPNTELDKYVSQYVQKGTEDVILMTEDNINEILGFCREEIEQNTLAEGNVVICNHKSASEFIRNLLVSLRKRLEESGTSLEKLDKYIEYFGISDGIGLSRRDGKTGDYYYGNEINQSRVFYYKGEWEVSIARDCYGDTEERLASHDFDELRKLDENRKTCSDDKAITVDDYLKKKIATSVGYFLGREIIAKQIKIRENHEDDSGCYFEDEFLQLRKLRKLYRDATEKIEIESHIEKDVDDIRNFESDVIYRQGAILLTEENIEELIGFVREAVQRIDYSNCEKYKKTSGNAYNFTLDMLKKLREDLRQEPTTDEKVERIEAYLEYIQRVHSIRTTDVGEYFYEYCVGDYGKIGFKVIKNVYPKEIAYNMENGCEDVRDLLYKMQIEEKHLRRLDACKERNEQGVESNVDKADVRTEGITGILSGNVLRQELRTIDSESGKNKRQEFRQKMQNAIKYFEDQR